MKQDNTSIEKKTLKPSNLDLNPPSSDLDLDLDLDLDVQNVHLPAKPANVQERVWSLGNAWACSALDGVSRLTDPIGATVLEARAVVQVSRPVLNTRTCEQRTSVGWFIDY